MRNVVDFELILARFCDAFGVAICNLLDFSIEVSIFFPRLHPVPLALVITTEVVLVLNSAWFSGYRLPSRKQNGQIPLHGPYEYLVCIVSKPRSGTNTSNAPREAVQGLLLWSLVHASITHRSKEPGRLLTS